MALVSVFVHLLPRSALRLQTPLTLRPLKVWVIRTLIRAAWDTVSRSRVPFLAANFFEPSSTADSVDAAAQLALLAGLLVTEPADASPSDRRAPAGSA